MSVTLKPMPKSFKLSKTNWGVTWKIENAASEAIKD